tara:strand:- start:12312 stop:12557 length:246 start_codon:yes stop_codon:yes gene_type:complete
MADQNDWYRVLSIARSNAANDLVISNKILEISDVILRMREKDTPSEDEILEVSNRLVEVAMEMADKSKDMNFAITKLMGVI